jgi:hypothetical protein
MAAMFLVLRDIERGRRIKNLERAVVVLTERARTCDQEME